MKYEIKAMVPMVFVVSTESAAMAKTIADRHLAQQFENAKILSIILVSPTEGDPSVEAWDKPEVGGVAK